MAKITDLNSIRKMQEDEKKNIIYFGDDKVVDLNSEFKNQKNNKVTTSFNDSLTGEIKPGYQMEDAGAGISMETLDELLKQADESIESLNKTELVDLKKLILESAKHLDKGPKGPLK